MSIKFTIRRDYFNKTDLIGYAARFDNAAAAYNITCLLIMNGITCQPKMDFSVYVPMHNKGLMKTNAAFLALCDKHAFTIAERAA